MRRIAALLVVTLSAAGGLWWWAQNGAAEGEGEERRETSEGESGPRPAVEGRVVDGDGEPVEGAIVEAERGDEVAEATTAEDGSFAFASLESGKWEFDVRADGYAVPGPSDLRRVEIRVPERERGERPREVEFTVRRPARLEGRVVAGDTPVPSVRLTLYYLFAEGFREGIEPYASSNRAQTNEDGTFEIDGVAPGRLRIIAESPEHATIQSRELFVEPGESVDGIEIDLAPRGVLTGSVVGSAGAAPSSELVLTGERLQSQRETETSAEGTFTFGNLPSGHYRLTVRAEGYWPETLRKVEVEEGEPTTRTVRLKAGEGLFGRVLRPDGRSVAGAYVRMENNGDRVEWSRTNQKGRFQWAEPPEGPWSVSAISPEYAASRTISAVPGRAAEIRLGEGGGIEGRVVDAAGRPVEGAELGVSSMMVDGPRPYGVRAIDTVRSDGEDGSFRFGPLRPGRYALEARKKPYAAGETRRVTVEAGSTAGGIRVVVGNGGSISGTVRSKGEGEPIAGARISVLDMSSPFESRSAKTDDSGRFELRRVPAGRRSIQVEHENHLTRILSGIEVPEGGTVERDVALRRGKKGEEFGFRGIGAALGRTDEGVVIRNVLPGGGAEKSGLKRGDVIRTVDRERVDDLPLTEIVQKIRGRAGEPVRISLEREGRGKFTVEIDRERVVVEGRN